MGEIRGTEDKGESESQGRGKGWRSEVRRLAKEPRGTQTWGWEVQQMGDPKGADVEG